MSVVDMPACVSRVLVTLSWTQLANNRYVVPVSYSTSDGFLYVPQYVSGMFSVSGGFLTKPLVLRAINIINLRGKEGKSQTNALPSLGGPVDVDGSPIVRSMNINKSTKKQKKLVRGGHHSVKMVTAVWPQQVIDL